MESTEKKSVKKPYHAPQISVYGNIRDLTENKGTKGKDDGGGYLGLGNTKTH